MPIMSFSRGIIIVVVQSAHYKTLFEAEKDDIGPENTCFWDVKSE
jgi:hypothetical protein